MPKAAFHNLGCKVNAYETEAMQQQLAQRGYEIVPFDEKADVYIINTCSVTNIADRKSRQMLHRAKKLNPQALVVAAGCYVQVASEELKKDASVDLIIGKVVEIHVADDIILPNGKLDYKKLRLLGRAGYWDYGVMEDTFAMKVPGVSAARMAAMEGRKPNEADLEKDKKENSL